MSSTKTNRRTWVLVHGAWHGGWAWSDVARIMQERGATVLAPTLPGHHASPHAAGSATMESYVESIVAILTRQPDPVVLVGHSLAGAVISQVADLAPDKVSQLIYVAGFLPKDQESVLDIMQADSEGRLLDRLSFTPGGEGAVVDEATLREVIYNQTEERGIQRALPRLLPAQAVEPLTAKVSLSAARFGSVPRAFVKCTHDRLFSAVAQQRAIDSRRGTPFIELDADHVPFFSRPVELAGALLAIGTGACTAETAAAVAAR